MEDAFREFFYIVPDCEREYVWTDKDQLLDDIIAPSNEMIFAFTNWYQSQMASAQSSLDLSSSESNEAGDRRIEEVFWLLKLSVLG